jgi:hypothetical protein
VVITVDVSNLYNKLLGFYKQQFPENRVREHVISICFWGSLAVVAPNLV